MYVTVFQTGVREPPGVSDTFNVMAAKWLAHAFALCDNLST